MCQKSVLEKRLGLITLLSKVELELLHDLLVEAEDNDYSSHLDFELARTSLELMTNPNPIVLLWYSDVEEDHSEYGDVVFRYGELEGNYRGVDGGLRVACDLLKYMVVSHEVGHFYWGECYYLVITPEEARVILENHRENWEEEIEEMYKKGEIE